MQKEPVLIRGIGGEGKTQICIEICNRLRKENHFSGGVFWLQFDEISKEDDIVDSVRQQIDSKSVKADIQDIGDVSRILEHSNILLVLDSVGSNEKLFNSLYRKIIRKCSMLITSRKLLITSIDHQIELPPLSKEDARELYLSYSKLTTPEEQDIYDLCEKLGNSPLGILLLATYNRVKCKSLEQIKKDFWEILAAIDYDIDGIPRNSSIIACFDFSFRELNKEEQKVFLDAAIFDCSFKEEELYVTVVEEELSTTQKKQNKDISRHLDKLVEYSLINRKDGGEMTMPAFVKVFAHIKRKENLRGKPEQSK